MEPRKENLANVIAQLQIDVSKHEEVLKLILIAIASLTVECLVLYYLVVKKVASV